MKRIFLVAISVLVFGFANAQKTRFGVKGGLNIATIGGAEEAKASALIGFQVGGFAEINVWKKFFIQPELLFSAQGAKFEYDGARDFKINLNYINIPVLAKYYITKEFTVEAGPQLGFLVSSKNISNENSIDLGFNLGAGYNFTDNFSVGIRYTIGLSDVYEYANNDDIDGFGFYDGGHTNNVLALTAAYKF
ncbi:porin family protein [Flavobacterium sp. LC2016-12]|uniref:porin family protein n=1 Tax=Flavobacterium sp. LC2016-12 TaxID=2783794 RepID=UPI00188B5C3F|nr:porin family protein [Flavobacterium sp. LC2016-12]MBF4466951.1 PorT family protein [Flavobacterium sp. LC2016-12]